MSTLVADRSEFEAALDALYRHYFETEAERRWPMADAVAPLAADVSPDLVEAVETFAAQKMKIVDRAGVMLQVVRSSKGPAWFFTLWAYEELRHGVGLCDWLLQSGLRSREQMTELEDAVSARPWQPPFETREGLMAHVLVEEAAAALCCARLRSVVKAVQGDSPLAQLLTHIHADEEAHRAFFLECVRLSLKFNPGPMLRALRQAQGSFTLPVLDDLADGRQRRATLVRLGLGDDRLFEREVRRPLLAALGQEHADVFHRSLPPWPAPLPERALRNAHEPAVPG